jgi:hypothetical protein
MAAALAVAKKLKVWEKGVVEKWIYNSGTVSLADTPTTTYYKIPVRDIQGRISEVSFESQSVNCDVWLGEIDALGATSYQTILLMSGINLGYSPELSVPRYYVNQDSTPAAFLYLTIKNLDTLITSFSLSITFERY